MVKVPAGWRSRLDMKPARLRVASVAVFGLVAAGVQANGWSTPPIPDITFNPTSASVEPTLDNFAGNGWTQGPLQNLPLARHAGQVCRRAVDRPGRGAYGVIATFAGVTGNNGTKKATSDVHVQHLGRDLPGATASLNTGTTGNAFSFLANVTVAAAESLDFAVGDGGDG